MNKYSDEFKVEIALEYLGGRTGYRMLAEKYNVKTETQIKNWVSA
ncbi:hypothetical protein ACFSFY_00275 [Sporosarcina siberiensis]|uniref:Transposase n=1 Tax=Sporosarcina siberiensis TaxID=1365606 RepID=A0ABW4SB05_9BACL